jgi:tRNA pseudouridine13 synthase
MPTGDVLTLETSILAEEGVRLEEFRKVVGIRLPGTRRPLRMPIQLHKVSAIDSGTGICLGFTLPAGGYATVVVEELLADIQPSNGI